MFWPIVLTMLAGAFVLERVLELLWILVGWMVGSRRGRSAGYRQFKAGVSLLLSAILGVLLAAALNLHLFVGLKVLAPGFAIDVPANWDLVITGLIVGLLAKPVHDLVELLAQSKNFLGAAAGHQREAAGADRADGMLKFAQSEQQNLLDVPGAGLTPLTGGEPSQPAAAQPSVAERYVAEIRKQVEG